MPDLQHVLGACIPFIKSVPGTAITEAVQAAENAITAAEQAALSAELAAQRSYAVTEDGEKIIFTSTVEGGGN